MSRENVEIVRISMDAVQRGDADRALSAFSEVVFEPLVAGPDHGHAGVMEQWAVFWEEFDDFWFEADELIDAGEQVVLLWRHGGIGTSSGIRTEQAGGTVFGLRDGRIHHAIVYADRAGALQAAGLSE